MRCGAVPCLITPGPSPPCAGRSLQQCVRLAWRFVWQPARTGCSKQPAEAPSHTKPFTCMLDTCMLNGPGETPRCMQ